LPDTNKSSKRISPQKLSNLKVVVLCIAAATTFWILNALNKDDYTTVVDYPIELSYDKEKYMAVEKEPDQIQIEIRGNGWDLLRKYFKLNTLPFLVSLDNPAAKNFIRTTDLRRDLGEYLSPTTVISILDDSLKFKIDRIQTLKVPAIVDSSSYSLAKNYRLLSSPKFNPAEISLTGPSSILEQLKGGIQIAINEQKIKSDLSKELVVKLPKEIASLVSSKEETVTVTLDVIAFLEGNKRLKIQKLNFPKSVSLSNEEVSIVMDYLIDERSVEDLKEMEFEAILNYSKRNKADSTITIEVRPMPKFLDQIRISPSIVKLRYEN
jgi:YbbR domain-containing protein